MQNEITQNTYDSLINQIGQELTAARKNAIQTVNNILVQTYWKIGKYIVEYEQSEKELQQLFQLRQLLITQLIKD